MNFKKPKDDLINEVYYRVDNTLRHILHSHSPYGYGYGDPRGRGHPGDEAMLHAITYAVTEAIKVVIENTYTDQEFEEDLGLREKP